MAKFTTDGISFLEVSDELLNKFPHSLLNTMRKWYNHDQIGLSGLTSFELTLLVMAYSISESREDFDYLAGDAEKRAVRDAFF